MQAPDAMNLDGPAPWYALDQANAGDLSVFYPQAIDAFTFHVCVRLGHRDLVALMCLCRAFTRFIRGACRALVGYVDEVVHLRRVLFGAVEMPRRVFRGVAVELPGYVPTEPRISYIRRMIQADAQHAWVPETKFVEARLVPSTRPTGLRDELCLFDLDLTTVRVLASLTPAADDGLRYRSFVLAAHIGDSVGAATGQVEYTQSAIPVSALCRAVPESAATEISAWSATDRILVTYLAEDRAQIDAARAARAVSLLAPNRARPVYAPVLLDVPLQTILGRQRRSTLEYVTELRKDRAAPDYAEKLHANQALWIRGIFAVSSRLHNEGPRATATPEYCAVLRYLGPAARDAQHAGASAQNAITRPRY
jgi:hypothetical protein